MKPITEKLKGGDLRSIGKVGELVLEVRSQKDFDSLFKGLYEEDRKIVMRSADAIEKITQARPLYLVKHKEEIIQFLQDAKNIEFKWHLAQLVPRLELSAAETDNVWKILMRWAKDKGESKIVRVNSMQSLSELLKKSGERRQEYAITMDEVAQENIPSINARLKQIKKAHRL